MRQNGAGRILAHLVNFHDTECKHDRDHLYSLFGISTGHLDSTEINLEDLDPFGRTISSAEIRCGVDYSISTAQLYI
jgi:hypothetical protein